MGDKEWDLIADEFIRAVEKHPAWPADPVYAAALVAEEAGELVQAVNNVHEGRGTMEEARTEARHVVVTAMRFLYNNEEGRF